MIAEVVGVYVVGATATALFCTIMEHTYDEVRLDMRIRATLAWPLFWLSFAWALLIDED